MASHPITSVLTRAGILTARPSAFLVLVAYVILWAILQPHTLDWHGAATVATWAMTLFIQRAEHRDTQGIHAKLDELLRAHHAARSDLTHIDDEEPDEIEKARDQARKAD
jgi:low affinity Fe/Cu permease